MKLKGFSLFAGFKKGKHKTRRVEGYVEKPRKPRKPRGAVVHRSRFPTWFSCSLCHNHTLRHYRLQSVTTIVTNRQDVELLRPHYDYLLVHAQAAFSGMDRCS